MYKTCNKNNDDKIHRPPSPSPSLFVTWAVHLSGVALPSRVAGALAEVLAVCQRQAVGVLAEAAVVGEVLAPVHRLAQLKAFLANTGHGNSFAF